MLIQSLIALFENTAASECLIHTNMYWYCNKWASCGQLDYSIKVTVATCLELLKVDGRCKLVQCFILITFLWLSAFICHDSGATVLAYAPKHQLLISGGRKGFTCVIDLRLKQQQQLLQSHDSPVKAIAVDPTEEYFVTGSAEGNIKVLIKGREQRCYVHSE